VELPGKASIEVLAAGPLAAALRITRKLHGSRVEQEIWLRRSSPSIEFRTTVEWNEKHRMLKVNFPLALHANEAVHEVQFGHLRRPNHASRPFDADRFEVCNHKWTALTEENRGAAVLNDCKYGVNVLGNTIQLTLLRAAQAPDPVADLGLQVFTYALYAWHGSLAQSEVVRQAYDLNVPLLVVPGAGGEGSLFHLDAANIVLEALKPADDGSADLVLRLYESKHMTGECTLTTPLPVRSAAQTDLMEEHPVPLECAGGRVRLHFRPFEIKTVRLKL
jgi:alpha-mannosidase